MRRAPLKAAMGINQLIEASDSTRPSSAVTPAAPAQSSRATTTIPVRAGRAVGLIRHSNLANKATSRAVAVVKTMTHKGRVSHHAVVPGSNRNTAPSKANNPVAPTMAIADRCHRYKVMITLESATTACHTLARLTKAATRPCVPQMRPA